MSKTKRTKYSTQQWKSVFSTLFISTTLVLMLLLIAMSLKFSSANGSQNTNSTQSLVVSLKPSFEPLDKLILERDINQLDWVDNFNYNAQNQLIISLKHSQVSVEQISNDLSGGIVETIAYPQLLNCKEQHLRSDINQSLSLLLITTAFVSWVFSFLILKSLFYSKRKHIYYTKLVGASKGYLLKKHSTIVFWCSLAAGLTAIVLVSIAIFTLSLVDTNSLSNININGLFLGLIITPIWGILINGINSWYIISKIYRLNKKQIYSI